MTIAECKNAFSLLHHDTQEALLLIAFEMERAKRKHPKWPISKKSDVINIAPSVSALRFLVSSPVGPDNF